MSINNKTEEELLVTFHGVFENAERPARLALLKEYAQKQVKEGDQRPLSVKRKEFYEQDYPARGYCKVCKKNEAHHRHHVIELENGGSNNLGNLIGLCRECHEKIHPHMRGVFFCPFHRIILLKRLGPRGPFLGCPKYPKCKYTRNIEKETL